MDCIGIGYITENIELKKDANEATYARFVMKCPEYKATPKKLMFEIWDSAAIYLSENTKKGSTVFYKAVPRVYGNEIVFRIQSFNVIKK